MSVRLDYLATRGGGEIFEDCDCVSLPRYDYNRKIGDDILAWTHHCQSLIRPTAVSLLENGDVYNNKYKGVFAVTRQFMGKTKSRQSFRPVGYGIVVTIIGES